jgi:hypothetical protein
MFLSVCCQIQLLTAACLLEDQHLVGICLQIVLAASVAVAVVSFRDVHERSPKAEMTCAETHLARNVARARTQVVCQQDKVELMLWMVSMREEHLALAERLGLAQEGEGMSGAFPGGTDKLEVREVVLTLTDQQHE